MIVWTSSGPVIFVGSGVSMWGTVSPVYVMVYTRSVPFTARLTLTFPLRPGNVSSAAWTLPSPVAAALYAMSPEMSSLLRVKVPPVAFLTWSFLTSWWEPSPGVVVSTVTLGPSCVVAEPTRFRLVLRVARFSVFVAITLSVSSPPPPSTIVIPVIVLPLATRPTSGATFCSPRSFWKVIV